MKKITLLTFAVLFVFGCKTTPETEPVDYSDEIVLIQVKGPGVAPTGNGLHDEIEFQILAGTNHTPEKWLLEIVDEQENAVRKVPGKGSAPQLWSWDGKTDNGKTAPDGLYRGRLSIWFSGMSEPFIQETAGFVVDTTGPEGSIAFAEGLFSPDEDGINDTIEITVSAKDDLSGVQSWTLDIYDSHDAMIKSFNSESNKSGAIVWDGTDNGRVVVGSAADYRAVLRALDNLGNSSLAEESFSTDILVWKEGDTFRIRVNSITFKPYRADFLDVGDEQRLSNLETLDLLAEKLKKFPDHRITVEGHAVSVFWNNPVKAEKENREVLLPLSEARARIVLEALQERGVNAVSMDYVGMGAIRPIVPFSDLQNRWKNRRVVFILKK
ncbi:OmpA family protein [Spirochaeta isovalerica]|uniref:Flagellar hook assembly protein FlgD n=1 Tax=Spirochaeta isovalerica TaxID=150 RepID=A0A841RFI6_9SPIO|nr:OmpA family protein [Spirochaeta isovalerica]MBB6481338.1 flagellar hook assembly protein FlgD [Spirochaeta isovalerica]